MAASTVGARVAPAPRSAGVAKRQQSPSVRAPHVRTALSQCHLPIATRSACHSASLSTERPRRSLVKVNAATAAADDSFGGPTEAAEVEAGSSTFLQAVLNVMNILMGVGIMTIPYALGKSGWMGLGVLVFLGLVTNYSGKALVEAHQVVKAQTGKAVVGYEDIAEAGLGKAGRAIVSAMVYVELFGTCTLLFILQGDNLLNLLGTEVFATKKLAMITAAAAMIPTVWLPNVTALSYLGFLGVFATAAVVGTVIYTFLSGNFVAGAATALVHPTTLPLTFGVLAFVYAGHGVFPAIQASMKEPQLFSKALNTAYLFVGGFCAIIGGLGYYMYGSNAADVIIFSLPPGLLALLCSCLVMINPIAKYALTLEPVGAALQGSALGRLLPQSLRRAATRTLLALGSLVAAMYVPYLAMVMSLIGAVLTISISVILPGVLHLKLVHGGKDPSATKFSKAWDYMCIVIGVICAVSGTIAALQGLAAQLALGA